MISDTLFPDYGGASERPVHAIHNAAYIQTCRASDRWPLAQLSHAFAQTSPQRSTGDPVIALDGQSGGTLENDRIEATWQIHNKHLTALVIRDKTPQAGFKDATLNLDGPFSIELKAIGVQRASDLQISGPARIDHLTPNPSASRASDRLPGVTVHYSLTDPEGRFTPTGLSPFAQGSHYIRQILTVTAGAITAAASNGISLIDVRSPGIAVPDTVKGSPLDRGQLLSRLRVAAL